MIKGLRELADYWDADTEESRKINEAISEIERLQAEISEADSLLSDAHDLMNDVHCYDTEIYREISKYFNGGDDDE